MGDFAQFWKGCGKPKGWNDIFVRKNSWTSNVRLFCLIYIVCCKKFVDFQIHLFLKTDSFPLSTVYCRCSCARRDVGFDYETNIFLEVYYNTDNNSESDEQINCFTSSVCFTEMRANLMFERFFQSCQNAFLMYFTRNLHVIWILQKSIKVCHCFFDVVMYCLMKNVCYREFFSLCMKERDDRKKHKDKANTRMNIFTLLMGSRKVLNILKRPYNILYSC